MHILYTYTHMCMYIKYNKYIYIYTYIYVCMYVFANTCISNLYFIVFFILNIIIKNDFILTKIFKIK